MIGDYAMPYVKTLNLNNLVYLRRIEIGDYAMPMLTSIPSNGLSVNLNVTFGIDSILYFRTVYLLFDYEY